MRVPPSEGASSQYNNQLIEAYTRVYAAVLNPSAGYGADARSRSDTVRTLSAPSLARHSVILSSTNEPAPLRRSSVIKKVAVDDSARIRGCVSLDLELHNESKPLCRCVYDTRRSTRAQISVDASSARRRGAVDDRAALGRAMDDSSDARARTSERVGVGADGGRFGTAERWC